MWLIGRRLCLRCCVSAVQVKDGGFIIGAYTHCKWPAASGRVADPTGKSFLFSLVNADGKAVRFSLRDKDRAIELGSGINFGGFYREGGKVVGWPNFILMHKGQAADQKDANFAFDPKEHGAAYQSGDGDDIFFCNQYFPAEKIEIYQL